MEVDQAVAELRDSAGVLQGSSEVRRYLELVVEHEAGACLHPGCPECLLLAKICQFIQSEVFTEKEYPVSIGERNTAAPETAASDAVAPATQRFSRCFLSASVGATVAAETPGASKVRSTQPVPEALPVEEQVRRRAYDLYLRRGGHSGFELDDWLQAEQEIVVGRAPYWN